MSEGTLTEQERAELDAALLVDADLRAQAAGWLCEESLLRQEAAVLVSLAGDDLVNRSAQQSSEVTVRSAEAPVPGFPYRIAVTIGSAVLACSLLLNVVQWRGSGPTGGQWNQFTAVAQGARLTKVTGCIWDSSSESAPVRGGALSGGDALKLLQGIAEIDLHDSNARCSVRLLGPCTAEMRSAGLPKLQSGRMVADLSVFGPPVEVRTPIGVLVLSEDASLGIVRGDGHCSVHVLEGVAHWKNVQSQSAADITVLRDPIRQGEAISCQLAGSQPGSFQKSTADTGVFAEERLMATDALGVDARYAELVMAAEPTSYWRFTRTPTGVLENEVRGGMRLMMGGEVSTVSYGANSVLEFGMTRHAGYLYSEDLWPAEPLKDFSAEVWVKPSHFHNGSIFALTTDRQPRGTFPNHSVLLELGGAQEHWRSLTPLNSLRYLLRSPPSGTQEGEFGSSVSEGYEVRRWQHLAYVKRAARLELYRNGSLVASDDGGEDSVIASEMQFVCGRLYPHGSERLFVGQMDELAIYERALSEREIKKHFLAGASSAAPAAI